MAKVKKRTGVAGERNVRSKPARRDGRKGSKQGASSKRSAASRKKAAKAGKAKQAKTKKAVRSMRNTKVHLASKGAKGTKVASPVTGRVAIKPLDPLRKCGPNTSVQFLYRVDESVDGRSTAHLVFFDRHGWYCEHGRTCPAVGHAKKYNGQIARVS